jgi:signal transduction histidine kinase
MKSSADYPRSFSGSEVSATSLGKAYPPRSAVELIFTQDESGQYLSFQWQAGEQYGLKPEQLLGSRMADGVFHPITLEAYTSRVRRVVDRMIPEQFKCPFRYGDYTFLFELVVNPIMLLEQSTAIAVTGRLLSYAVEQQIFEMGESTAYPIFPSSSDRYQKLLTQIAWNIRRTLDPTTIWQQTVNGLGRALGVSRCVICPYENHSTYVKVVAEYCREPFSSLLELDLSLWDNPYLSEAIETLKPIRWENCTSETSFVNSTPALPSENAASALMNSGYLGTETIAHEGDISATTFDVEPEQIGLQHLATPTIAINTQQQSILAIATCYQDQPNGLIILYQCDRPRTWTDAEVDFMQELADQVGTAIAHASLFTESQTLASELQRVNVSMLQKNRELEDARQQAEEASRLKSEFLANTSHELRTPLNGMIGFLKLILDGMADDPQEQNEFLNEAYRSALHLLNIINDVLDIAKIEAGKMQIELSPVHLDELLGNVENFTRSQVQQKNLSFEIQKLPTHDEIVLFGNYQRLLQVMLNLVGNAIKFTHEGGVTISTEVIKKRVVLQNHELPGMVKVRVADTGIGVSLDKQDKLFQSFSQVDGSRTRQYGGTGLGLAISQKLVEAMGGVVNFYSMGEGLGSTVTFTVPLYQEPVMIAAGPGDELDLRL